MKNIGWAELREQKERKYKTILQVLICLALGATLGMIFADPIYVAICANMGVTP